MSKTDLEIKCLARLDELLASNDSIMEFLIAEELLNKEQRKAIKSSHDIAKALQLFLASMKGNKLQLIEYEWVLLPEERLKVTLVTDRNNREFSFNY
jgi:hypothetical protein